MALPLDRGTSMPNLVKPPWLMDTLLCVGMALEIEVLAPSTPKTQSGVSYVQLQTLSCSRELAALNGKHVSKWRLMEGIGFTKNVSLNMYS